MLPSCISDPRSLSRTPLSRRATFFALACSRRQRSAKKPRKKHPVASSANSFLAINFLLLPTVSTLRPQPAFPRVVPTTQRATSSSFHVSLSEPDTPRPSPRSVPSFPAVRTHLRDNEGVDSLDAVSSLPELPLSLPIIAPTIGTYEEFTKTLGGSGRSPLRQAQP